MAFIDEINQHLESERKSIINIKDNDVIIQIEKCLINYMKYYIRKNIESHKLMGIVFINNWCDKTTYNDIRCFSQYKPIDFPMNFNHLKMPITICCTPKPLDIIPNIYYVDNEIVFSRDIEEKFKNYTCKQGTYIKIYDYIGLCNSFTNSYAPILYSINNNLFLCPFAYHNDDGHIWVDTFDRDALDSGVKLENSIMNNYDDLIIKLSNLLQQWFYSEGLINNKVSVKTFNQVIPIKKVPCYKFGLFGKRKLVGEKEIISSDCNNKCIVFEVEW